MTLPVYRPRQSPYQQGFFSIREDPSNVQKGAWFHYHDLDVITLNGEYIDVADDDDTWKSRHP